MRFFIERRHLAVIDVGNRISNDEARSRIEHYRNLTIIKSPALETGHDEFDVNQKFLCVVPGLKGHSGRFTLLCERLKLLALVLQPGLSHPDETPQELAARFAKSLKKRLLLGLEGTVFCLGGAPKDVLAEVNYILNQFKSEEKLQHMLRMNLGNDSSNIQLKGTWEEKVSLYVKYLTGKVTSSLQYSREYVLCAYGRINQIRQCKVQVTPLKSQVIFLKSRVSVESCDSYQNYSEQPVIVYNLNTSLVNVTQDLQCMAIVNRHLEDEILKAFNKANLCFTYSCKANSGKDY
ncbi:unnamed protein product [Pieris brassicae]|uniref:Uncharacterized protein n=1 Tax=Pieris brassicae TaxID=7116 RepID=A0A9P0TH25_PIEBR|nr:unnamed protein product [Pieris brassicae]